MINVNVPLKAKNNDGHLRVIFLGRVSTPQQDLQNIPASFKFAENYLKQIYQGPIKAKYLGEQASGMLAERATILEAEELIISGQWDLVIAEDLSRIYRNPRYQWAFMQDCVDQQTRVICIADNLDTADENWEIMMHTAALRHGLHVPDTRRRVRRTASHAFHQGGMVQKVRYGYRKLSKEEAASGRFGTLGLCLVRLPECTAVIQQMRARIMRGDNYEVVADWLRAEGIPTGPFVQKGQWTGRLVEDLLRDPILCGTRHYRMMVYEPVYRSGKHRRRRNANGPETEYYPELAHLTSEEHAELLTVMDARKGDLQFPTGPDNPLWNHPRSRSYWPGQHACCGICGGRMHRYGKYLRCKNAPSKGLRTCWNGVQVDMAMVHAQVLPWVMRIIDQYPDFRTILIQSAWTELNRLRSRHQNSGNDIQQRIQQLEHEADNLATAIAKGGRLDALVRKVQEVDTALREAREEKARLNQQTQEAGIFTSPDDIAARLEEALKHLALTSFDFADLLRRLLPEFIILPVQALDTGQIRPRAKLTLSLAAWATEGEPEYEVSVVMDLFEPPVHIQHMARCVAFKEAHPRASYDTIARELGINRMTVKRAFAYQRLMVEAGLTDPYREVQQQPEQASRWRKRSKDEPAI